jgi:hypothetical protein
MELIDRIKKLIEVFRVANDDIIGNTARQVFNLNWSEGLSSRNQAHKPLDTLALTKQIIKGKGFYAVKGYRGEYKDHDKAVTHCIKDLILTKLPISIRREVSFTLGIRSDVVGIIGKNNKGTAFWLEVCDTETDAYFSQKVTALKNNRPVIIKALTELFATNIPDFTLVVHGKQHPEAMDFETYLEEVKK